MRAARSLRALKRHCEGVETRSPVNPQKIGQSAEQISGTDGRDSKTVKAHLWTATDDPEPSESVRAAECGIVLRDVVWRRR